MLDFSAMKRSLTFKTLKTETANLLLQSSSGSLVLVYIVSLDTMDSDTHSKDNICRGSSRFHPILFVRSASLCNQRSCLTGWRSLATKLLQQTNSVLYQLRALHTAPVSIKVCGLHAQWVILCGLYTSHCPETLQPMHWNLTATIFFYYRFNFCSFTSFTSGTVMLKGRGCLNQQVGFKPTGRPVRGCISQAFCPLKTPKNRHPREELEKF